MSATHQLGKCNACGQVKPVHKSVRDDRYDNRQRTRWTGRPRPNVVWCRQCWEQSTDRNLRYRRTELAKNLRFLPKSLRPTVLADIKRDGNYPAKGR